MINRKEVYDKYNGKCAYCGCDITLEQMQIDHLVPLYRNNSDKQLNEWGKIRGTDEIENLMPSCRSCNHYKSTFSLEEYREQLMLLRERLNKQHKIYSTSKRYRLIEEKPNKIVFFFEKPKLTCSLGEDITR
jgi:5-methylcytosine-specific restriction endonuclease McrA